MLWPKTTAVDSEERVNVNATLAVNTVAGETKTFEELCNTFERKAADKE